MQHPFLLLFIGLYLLGTIGVGWWASRRVKSTADFVIAGKRLPMFMAACALFATWFGSETVMGASSEFVQHGVQGIIEDPFGASLCLLLAGLLVARPLYKLNFLTFSDFFRMRFGRKAEAISAFFMVISYFGWIAAQIVALAVVLQVVSGLDRSWGVVLCTGVVLLYTYIGGMWAVAVTDFVQTIAIIVGLTILAIDLVLQVGGLSALTRSVSPDFFQFLPDPHPKDMVQWFAALITIGLGSIPQQDVFQRVMGARSERAAVHACYLSSIMYLTVALLPLVIGYCAKTLYPDLLKKDAQMLIPAMVLQHTGLGMQVLFFGALLSAILSTCSGAMLAPATVFGENLIRPLFPNMSDAALLRFMRLSLVGVAIVTGLMALSRNNIYELVGESSALSLVSLLIPLLAGLYWEKASSLGAILSMVFGMAVWWGSLQVLPEEAADQTTFWKAVPPILYGALASALGMLAGSWLNSSKPL